MPSWKIHNRSWGLAVVAALGASGGVALIAGAAAPGEEPPNGDASVSVLDSGQSPAPESLVSELQRNVGLVAGTERTAFRDDKTLVVVGRDRGGSIVLAVHDVASGSTSATVGSADDAARGRLALVGTSADQPGARIAGLVPDEVASVSVTTATGSSVSPVDNNVFLLRGVQKASRITLVKATGESGASVPIG